MSNMMTVMPSSTANEEEYDDITKKETIEASDLLLSVEHHQQHHQEQQQQQQIKPLQPQQSINDSNGMSSSSKNPSADGSDQCNTLKCDDIIKHNKASPISISNSDSNGHQIEKNDNSHADAKIDNLSSPLIETKKIISSDNKNDKKHTNNGTNTNEVETFNLRHRLFKYPVEGRIRNDNNKKKSKQHQQQNHNNIEVQETNNDQQQQKQSPEERSVSKTNPTTTPTKGQQNATTAATAVIGYEPVYKDSITYKVLQNFNKVDLAYKIEDHPFHRMQQKANIDKDNNNITMGKNSRTTRSSSTVNLNHNSTSTSTNLLDSQFGPYNNTISDIQQSSNNVNKQSILIKNVYFRPNVFPQHDHQGLQLIHKQQHEQQEIQQQQPAQHQHQKAQMQQPWQHQPQQPPPQQEPLPQQQNLPFDVRQEQYPPTSFYNKKNNDDDSRISVRITHGPYQGQTGYLVNVIDGKFSVIQNDETKSTITINNSYVESIHAPRIRIAQKPPPPPLPCPPPPVYCPPAPPVYSPPPTPVHYPPPTPPLHYNPAPNNMTTSPPIGYSYDTMTYGNNHSYNHPSINNNNNHPMGLSNSVAEYKQYVPIMPTGIMNTTKTKNVKKRKQAAVAAIEQPTVVLPTKKRRRRRRMDDGTLQYRKGVPNNERYSSPLSKDSSKAKKPTIAIGYSPSYVPAGLERAVMPIQISQPITTNAVVVTKKRRRRKLVIGPPSVSQHPIIGTTSPPKSETTAVAAFPPPVAWKPVTTKEVVKTKQRRKLKQVVSVTNGQNIYNDGRTRNYGGRFEERKNDIPILESQIDIAKSPPHSIIAAKGSDTKMNININSLLVSMKQTQNPMQQDGQSASTAFIIDSVKMAPASLLAIERSPETYGRIQPVVTEPSESIVMPVPPNFTTTIEKANDAVSHVKNNETIKDTKSNHNNGLHNKDVVESSLHDTNSVLEKMLREEVSVSSSEPRGITNSRQDRQQDSDKAKKKLWDQAASSSERRDNTSCQQDSQQEAMKKGGKDVVIEADTATIIIHNTNNVSSESPSPNLLNTATTAPPKDILLTTATTEPVVTPLEDEYQTTTTTTTITTTDNNNGRNEKVTEEEKVIDMNEQHQHVVSDNKSPVTTTASSSIGILGTFKNLFLRR